MGGQHSGVNGQEQEGVEQEQTQSSVCKAVCTCPATRLEPQVARILRQTSPSLCASFFIVATSDSVEIPVERRAAFR